MIRPSTNGNWGYVDMGTFEASVAGLRQSHSFKEKRSSSGPAGRSQVTSAPLSVSTVTPQPHPSLSSIPDTESVTQTSAAQLQQHRRSLPTASKPISEDVDPFLSGQEPGSNIADTISESLESLDEADAPSEVNDNYDDELLMLRYDEAETWSGSIDRKVIKKMSHKDIKRQDTIWELIQTERHHCRRLKILQRIYSHTILEELHMPQEVVDRLFPNLDDLIEIHLTFLHSLQDLQNLRPDHSVDQIGETIVKQFDGESAEQMKAAYGGFCCRQKSSNQYYKDLLTKDRKFLSYMKKCNNHTLCNKREIPDFLLAVTQRPSKYLTLIEAILKSTKDKKDRENLIKALNLSRDLLHSIDEQVNQYELLQRLEEIYNKMDQRAVAMYKGKKFKRSDIIANGRCLLHEGSVQLKNARGKVTDAILVVLSDLIFFMQETNGKYNFFSQDSKSSVIPLFQLLVREKGDTRADNRGIYLISQNKQNPEMYEIICSNNNYRRNWIDMLRQATDGCPPEEVEEVPNEEDEEQKRLMDARSAKVKDIIGQLHHKDYEIKKCCDDKNKLMLELLDIYSWRVERKGATEEDSTEHMDALQTAIQEVSATASRLTNMLQGSGSHLSRHVSSVGEHVSSGFSLTPLPKRAETFAGFDSSFDNPKGCVPKKKYLAELQDLEGRSGSPQNVDSDPEICPVPEPSAYEKTVEADDSLDSSRQYDHYSHSDAGSLGDISGSSTQSNLIHGENHLASITQLARSLHSIVHLTAQQGTAVETLRAQLAEANERINKLSAEVHERKGGYRYNQLEELRNLQEMVRKEKQAFEREKERERNYAEQERQNLEEMKHAIKLEEEKMERERLEFAAEIQSQKEDLRQDKERYQAQIVLWESQLKKDGHSSAPGASQLSSSESRDAHSDFGQVTKRDNSPSSAQANHRRSASADFCQMIENDMDRIRQGNMKTSRREVTTSRSDSRAGMSSSASKKNLPEHLLSAKNEQKVSGIKVQQQLPTRSGLSSGQGSSSSLMGKGNNSVQQVLPFKLAASGSNSSINNVSGGAGHQNSASQKSYHPRSNMTSNKQSSSSSLSRIMKLAEPGSSKGRSSSLTSVPSLLLGDKSHTHKSASVDIPNSGAPQGTAQGKTDQSSEKADDEIYC